MIQAEQLNRFIETMARLGWPNPSVSVTSDAVEVQFGSTFTRSTFTAAIDFFELTAFKASQQGNMPPLKLNLSLGGDSEAGTISFSPEHFPLVYDAWVR